VTQIVIGRGAGRRAWLRRVTGRSLAATLLRHAPDYALHVVPSAADASPARSAQATRVRMHPNWIASIVSSLLVTSVVTVGELFPHWIEHEALGMLFLAVTVTSAILYGIGGALLSATLGFLCWNFFFIPPLYRLTIYDARDVVAILVFGGVAVSTGLMASRLHAAALSAQSRIEGLRRVGVFSRALGAPTTETALYEEIVRHAATIAGAAILLTGGEDTLDIRAAEPPADTLDEGSWAAAHWAYRRGEAAGSFTATLPSSPWRFLPVRIARAEGPRLLGLLGVRSPQRLPTPALQALEALADQAAIALERVRLANTAAHDAAMIETQKLRTALLNSLGHDLRTPLTGIRGAAETLRTAWAALTPETRADLLAAIEDDTARMSRFLDNITDMTRLESGEIAPTLVRTDPEEIVEAALARLRHAAEIRIALPKDLPPVLADPALLEQVVFNILDNAVKYAPDTPHIRISASAQDGRVLLRIEDAGIGIAAEDLPHVFDSFYRARRGDRVAAGTGLGLAIARGLIEAMGGSIAAVSPRPGPLASGPPDPGLPDSGLPDWGRPGTIITLNLPAAPP
jgi:two-component system sensor histidine kinase KdpD